MSAAPTAIIIGGGIAGLATANLLAKHGYRVTVLEKNDYLGGRAGQLKAQGFTFDTGPSWYLMPDVFDHYFSLLGYKTEQLLSLTKLTPAYTIYSPYTEKPIVMQGNLQQDTPTFERLEKGAGNKLATYVKNATKLYHASIELFLYHDFTQPNWHIRLLRKLLVRLRLLTSLPINRSLHAHVARHFKHPLLQKIVEYQMVFLGASPYTAPSIYNLMSHVDFVQGVYYPQGGIYSIIEALVSIGQKLSVTYHTSAPVKRLIIKGSRIEAVELENGQTMQADIIIGNTDLHHADHQLLPPSHRRYTSTQWQSKTLAPSAMLILLGIKGQLPLTHHNLIFTDDWPANFKAIFDQPSWPHPASIYICNPSATDPTVAPKDHTNLFILVPLAPGLDYTEQELDNHAEQYLEQLSTDLSLPHLRQNIVFKKILAHQYFSQHFNAWQGTALGLSHTWPQTALARPQVKHPHLDNFYQVGADSQPGIGLPMCLISAQIATKHTTKDHSFGPVIRRDEDEV